MKGAGTNNIKSINKDGFFSKGKTIANVDAIYTTDSFRNVDGIYCMPVWKYIA